MDQLNIIKVGGNVIDDQNIFRNFLKEFASVPGKNILVHGGGKIATQIGTQLGIEAQYIDGRRITNDETIDLVTMVYGGLINKKVVALLQFFGCDAMGVSGADGNLIPAIKRPKGAIDYGWVGDVATEAIPAGKWAVLLDAGWTPVVAPLTHDQEGHVLNTNADTIASVLSVSLSAYYKVRLIFCFEKKGVLEDVDDATSVISMMDQALYERLKSENKLFAGILPKLQNALDVRRSGVDQVIIGHSGDLHSLLSGTTGTQIV